MMVDLSTDVDAHMTRNAELIKILIGGKSETQKSEVTGLLKEVVKTSEGPAHETAMARLLERLEHMHHQNQVG